MGVGNSGQKITCAFLPFLSCFPPRLSSPEREDCALESCNPQPSTWDLLGQASWVRAIWKLLSASPWKWSQGGWGDSKIPARPARPTAFSTAVSPCFEFSWFHVGFIPWKRRMVMSGYLLACGEPLLEKAADIYWIHIPLFLFHVIFISIYKSSEKDNEGLPLICLTISSYPYASSVYLYIWRLQWNHVFLPPSFCFLSAKK